MPTDMPNNSATAEPAASNQRESLHAELDMALNILRFATAATDPELAQYVHGKACESFRRLSRQSSVEDMDQRALHALERRIKEFTKPVAANR